MAVRTHLSNLSLPHLITSSLFSSPDHMHFFTIYSLSQSSLLPYKCIYLHSPSHPSHLTPSLVISSITPSLLTHLPSLTPHSLFSHLSPPHPLTLTSSPLLTQAPHPLPRHPQDFTSPPYSLILHILTSSHPQLYTPSSSHRWSYQQPHSQPSSEGDPSQCWWCGLGKEGRVGRVGRRRSLN